MVADTNAYDIMGDTLPSQEELFEQMRANMKELNEDVQKFLRNSAKYLEDDDVKNNAEALLESFSKQTSSFVDILEKNEGNALDTVKEMNAVLSDLNEIFKGIAELGIEDEFSSEKLSAFGVELDDMIDKMEFNLQGISSGKTLDEMDDYEKSINESVHTMIAEMRKLREQVSEMTGLEAPPTEEKSKTTFKTFEPDSYQGSLENPKDASPLKDVVSPNKGIGMGAGSSVPPMGEGQAALPSPPLPNVDEGMQDALRDSELRRKLKDQGYSDEEINAAIDAKNSADAGNAAGANNASSQTAEGMERDLSKEPEKEAAKTEPEKEQSRIKKVIEETLRFAGFSDSDARNNAAELEGRVNGLSGSLATAVAKTVSGEAITDKQIKGQDGNIAKLEAHATTVAKKAGLEPNITGAGALGAAFAEAAKIGARLGSISMSAGLNAAGLSHVDNEHSAQLSTNAPGSTPKQQEVPSRPMQP